jgi:hypothetical protein
MTEAIALSPAAENFSLTRGGPFHRLISLIGPAHSERQKVLNRALFALLICWVPLLILSFVQGLAFGGKVAIPFLKDYAVHLRFLVALPILILAETPIDRRWRGLVQEFLKSGLVGQDESSNYDALLEKLSCLRDRALPEIAMLAIAYSAPIFLGKTELLITEITNWHMLDSRATEPSLAGWWFWLVSAPLFRFLLLRWIWRMSLWTVFIWRVSRLKLYLVATHTDLAAGLGFLSEGQRAFSPIVFAGGTVIAGSVLNAIRYEGETLASLKFAMIAYGVLAVVVLVVPLLVVTPVLISVKRMALREYGGLLTHHNQLFEAKWIRGGHAEGEVILGNPDPSSLADLGSSFDVIRRMGIVPVDKPTLVGLALAAALPMLPVILMVTPADEILRAVLKMLG